MDITDMTTMDASTQERHSASPHSSPSRQPSPACSDEDMEVEKATGAGSGRKILGELVQKAGDDDRTLVRLLELCPRGSPYFLPLAKELRNRLLPPQKVLTALESEVYSLARGGESPFKKERLVFIAVRHSKWEPWIGQNHELRMANAVDLTRLVLALLFGPEEAFVALPFEFIGSAAADPATWTSPANIPHHRSIAAFRQLVHLADIVTLIGATALGTDAVHLHNAFDWDANQLYMTTSTPAEKAGHRKIYNPQSLWLIIEVYHGDFLAFHANALRGTLSADTHYQKASSDHSACLDQMKLGELLRHGKRGREDADASLTSARHQLDRTYAALEAAFAELSEPSADEKGNVLAFFQRVGLGSQVRETHRGFARWAEACETSLWRMPAELRGDEIGGGAGKEMVESLVLYLETREVQAFYNTEAGKGIKREAGVESFFATSD